MLAISWSGTGGELAVERDDRHDTGALQHGQPLGGIDADKDVPGNSGKSTFFFRSFHRLQRAMVGRKAVIPFSSSCVRTTCSWRLRVHTANQRAGSACSVNVLVRGLIRRGGLLSRFLRRCRRQGIGRRWRQRRHFGLPDLLQLLVAPLNDRLRPQLGEVFLRLDLALLLVEGVRDLVVHLFRRQQLLARSSPRASPADSHSDCARPR